MNSEVLCEANKVARTITFHVREGFGDGTDGAGLSLLNPEIQERDHAISVFGKALDVVTGKATSAVPIERWIRMRYVPPPESVA